jgi:hypothetical protein
MSPEQAQQALDDLLVSRDKGHAQAAGWVGDAIYGVNDGLGVDLRHRLRRLGSDARQ